MGAEAGKFYLSLKKIKIRPFYEPADSKCFIVRRRMKRD